MVVHTNLVIRLELYKGGMLAVRLDTDTKLKVMVSHGLPVD